MESKAKKYFKLTKDGQLVLKDGLKAEIYIPQELLDFKIANIISNTVSMLGIFDIYVWENYSGGETFKKDSKLVRMKLPTFIVSKPERIIEDTSNKQIILEYVGGSELMVTNLLQKSSSNVATLVNVTLNGHLPDSIPYDKITSSILDSCEINSTNLGVLSLFLDIMVMVVSRDPDNINKTFRERINEDPKVSMMARKMVKMDTISTLTTQFNAITNGNPKFGITSTIGAEKTGETGNAEPTEIELAIE